MQPDITVIIAAYSEQRWDNLLEAVHSVQTGSRIPQQLIVVIDHHPALLERARQALPGVQVIANQQAPGLSGARNTGVLAASGEVLVFLDDDAAAQPDWLAQLLQPYQDERVAGVGGAILPVWQSGQPAWFPDEFLWVVGCTYRGVPTHPAQVRNLIGANMSFRRQVFSAVGLFLNDMGRLGALPMGCEETELCLRAARAMPETGFIYQPAAVVRHHVPAARATWRYFFARCFAEGRSKAQVARLAGGRRGLESERRYTLYTLPRGVLLGLYRALRHGEASGLGRAFAIAAGLALTTAGFISGTASVGRRALPSAPVKPQGERI